MVANERRSLLASNEEPIARSTSMAFAGEKTPAMCGSSVLLKIRGPQSQSLYPPVSQDESKSCLTPGKSAPRRRYHEVPGPLRSPVDTESSSSSSGDEGQQIHVMESVSSKSPYVIQFDPNPFKPDHAPQQATNALLPQDPARAVYGIQSSPWASSLPAVREETNSVETDSIQSLERDGKDARKSPRTKSSKESTEVLEAMRKLVLKQQAALRDMAQENRHYRTKLAEYQSQILKMKQDSSRQVSVVNQLTLDKEAFEAEAMWLREEIRVLQEDIDTDEMEVESKLREMMLGSRSRQSPSDNERSLLNGLGGNYKETLPSVRRYEMVAESSALDRAVLSLTQAHNNSWATEARDADPEDEERARQEKRDGWSMSGETSISDDFWVTSTTTEETAASGPGRRDEEVAQFKQRLDSIQKKRTERQTEKKQINKPTVRFGTMMV